MSKADGYDIGKISFPNLDNIQQKETYPKIDM